MAEAEVGNDVYEECPTVKRELDECCWFIRTLVGTMLRKVPVLAKFANIFFNKYICPC